MNKAELIDAIATDTNFSKKDTDLFLRAFIENVSKALENGDSVHLLGFGTFDVSERAARDGRNPKTGEKIHIPGSKLPRWRSSTALRDRCNNNKI